MDKLKYIKLENEDGSYSDAIPLAVDGDHVDINGNTLTSELNKKPYYYNNVANMKADTKLKAGDMAITLGYYEVNDGGRAEYNIIEDNTLVDDGGSIHDLNNGLKAKLIIDNFVNVKQMGAKGDGITDDTAKIQLALNICKNVYIPTGTYMINVDNASGIRPNSYNNIKMDSDAKLKAIPTETGNYSILKIYGISHFSINGGQIEGDKSEHLGSDGTWGHCIRIKDAASYINISNMYISKGWGDGLSVEGNSSYINTQNNIFDNNRRQGISVISASHFHSLNDSCINTSGTDPQSGVDIEPNYATDTIKDIVFENLYTENNIGSGLQIYIIPFTDANNSAEITIINHIDKGSQRGFQVSKPPQATGFIKSINPTYINSKGNAILGHYCYNSACKVEIYNPKIINANSTETDNSSPNHTVAIQMTNSRSEFSSYALGGLYIFNPYVTQTINDDNHPCIYIYNQSYSSAGVEDVKIINPTKLTNVRNWFEGINSKFVDVFEQTHKDADSDWNIRNSNLILLSTNSSYTSQHTVNVKNSVVPNISFKLRGENATYPLKVSFENGSTVFGLGNTSLSAPTINIAKGGELSVIKDINNNFYVTANNSQLVTV